MICDGWSEGMISEVIGGVSFHSMLTNPISDLSTRHVASRRRAGGDMHWSGDGP